MLVYLFFNDTATTEIYTLSLPDALPIFPGPGRGGRRRPGTPPAPGVISAAPGVVPPAAGTGTGGHQVARPPATAAEIGRAHVWNPVTPISRMSPSSWKKKNHLLKRSPLH